MNSCERNDSFIMYKIRQGYTRQHIIKVENKGDIISCSCTKFESMDITIRILDVVSGASKISLIYIFWKGEKNAKVDDIRKFDEKNLEKNSKILQRDHFSILYPILIRWQQKLLKQMKVLS